MRTIYLHIGRGKTGTTLIQRHLSRVRAALREQGVHYVLAGESGAGHQELAKSFIVAPPAVMIPAADPAATRSATLAEIAASDARTFLISSENFPLADVAAVAGFFGSLPGETTLRIILFARSQDELAESEYNQMVKLKRETRRFEDYATGALEGSDFFEEAMRWERALGEGCMTCRIYDGARRDVIDDFIGCIPELRPDLLPAAGGDDSGDYANASIGIKALVAARILNEVELASRPPLYRELFAGLAGRDLPALLFDSRQARAFRERFAESNRAFTARYLDGARDDLGGRRYSDEERDAIRAEIEALKLGAA